MQEPMPSSILSTIHSPADVKRLPRKRLPALAAEIRAKIVSATGKNGGHVASNLGIVELTLALHCVFDTPADKIVWDVGHQCYTHKMLTGRAGQFDGLRKRGGLSGFPKRSESEHDAFDTGHSSTSVSAALGLLASGSVSHAVAVIGDGALTGGMAYEALSHAGQLGLPLVVILNDNKMSIDRNVGGLSRHLSQLSMTAPYQRIRRLIDRSVRYIPFFGEQLFRLMMRFKRGVKGLFYDNNFFVDLGFEYVGPIDGHRLGELEEVLRDAKRLARPVVVHVMTQKGRGYEFAEDDPSSFHGIGPYSILDGKVERSSGYSFTEAYATALLELAGRDERVCALTAAMEKGTGLARFHRSYPGRFYDVGIAEQHECTFAAGLAAGGKRPLVSVYSTFLQRSLDQVIHDVAIPCLPVTFALDRSGFVPDDGETHQGLFDLAFLRTIPNMTIYCPASAEELRLMLDAAVLQGMPAAIRYPKAACPPECAAFAEALVPGRGVFIRDTGAPIVLAATGSLYPELLRAAEALAAQGLPVDLYNLRYAKPVDTAWLSTRLAGRSLFCFFEEGVSLGGVGEHLSSALHASLPDLSVVCRGAPDSFPAQATRAQLLAEAGLDAAGIISCVEEAVSTLPALAEKATRWRAG